MPEYTDDCPPHLYVIRPDPEEILERSIIMTRDPRLIAVALVPWARRHPRLTMTGALHVLGLKPVEFLPFGPIVTRALRIMGCRVEACKQGNKRWFFPDDRVVKLPVPTRVTCRGFSDDPDAPPPVPFQVLVCRAWLQECGRPTGQIQYKFSTESFKRMVTAWTRETGRFKDVEQVSEHTGDRFYGPVYVTNGAMLQAALDEGYHAKRLPDSGDAHLNLSYRRSAAVPWRGRTPKPWVPPKAAPSKPALPETRAARGVQALSVDLVKQRLAGLITRLPRFTIKEAAIAARVTWRKKRGRKSGMPPKVLTTALRELGFEPRYELRGRRRTMWWARRKSARPRGYVPAVSASPTSSTSSSRSSTT